MVGDIDVGREVLERIRSKWKSEDEYKTATLAKINIQYRNQFKNYVGLVYPGKQNSKTWARCDEKHKR